MANSKTFGSPISAKIDPETPGNLQMAPEDWGTGDEPKTGAPASNFQTLCEDTRDDFDQSLTNVQTSEGIDALCAKDLRLVVTGKGRR